ncbi:unannotated protein [freshwater metagenome]|uniref:Unannotated protein n=1 Tax=freshwater metagenome TaxID=449393 RepID=A0A6J6XV70_9ZZZZ
MIAVPPFELGADHETATLPSPPMTPVTTGASGTVTGVTAPEIAEASLVPMPFVAVTENV